MKYLSIAALVYAALWILNFLYGNYVTIVLQGLLGAGLFVALAVYINTLDGENSTSHAKFEQEITRLNKEIEDLKKRQTA